MRYRVETAPFSFGPGFVLGLSEAQAAARASSLAPAERGFVVIAEVQFKVGEVVEIIAGDIGKAPPDRLRPLDDATDDQPARRARRKAPAA